MRDAYLRIAYLTGNFEVEKENWQIKSGHYRRMKWKLLPNEIWAFWCLGMILRRGSNWCLPSHLWKNGMVHFFAIFLCFDLSLVFSFAICIDVVVAGGGGGDKTDAATCYNGLAPLSMFEFAFRERWALCFFVLVITFVINMAGTWWTWCHFHFPPLCLCRLWSHRNIHRHHHHHHDRHHDRHPHRHHHRHEHGRSR